MGIGDGRLAYGIDEAAMAVGIGRDRIYQAIREGRLRARRYRRRTLILQDDLRAFLDGLEPVHLTGQSPVAGREGDGR